MNSRALSDWLFRNRRSGQITVAQFPNIPLWLFLATVALRQVVATGTNAHTIIDWTGLVALGWWSVDEVVRGVNPWRRILGAGGCTAVVAGTVSLLR